MGLWEFLQQWRGGRAVAGVAASILLHVLVVLAVLWGARLPMSDAWRVRKGDALIVELPRPEESPAPGSPDVPRSLPGPSPAPAAAPPRPTAPPAPPAPPVAKPQPPAPPAPQRVVSTPRPPEPAKPAPAPPQSERPSQRAPEAPAESSADKAPASEPSSTASMPKVERVPPGAPAGAPAAPSNPQVASVPPGGGGPPGLDMRSALRRGAGGRGEGHGGILGDPIALDTPDPRFQDFLMQVKRQIEQKLTYPCIKDSGTRVCEPKDTEVIVHFGILKNGRLQYVDLWIPSPWRDYDETSMTAIRLAQPFPPVPAAIMASLPPGSTGMPIAGRFTYRVSYSTLVR